MPDRVCRGGVGCSGFQTDGVEGGRSAAGRSRHVEAGSARVDHAGRNEAAFSRVWSERSRVPDVPRRRAYVRGADETGSAEVEGRIKADDRRESGETGWNIWLLRQVRSGCGETADRSLARC